MKLSKKLMLFEEFTQTGTEVATEVAVDTTTQVSQPTDSVRTDIVSDVDSIISKLEDLARGIGQEEEANESALITEADGAVSSMLSAELYMIPLIAAGIVGGAAVGIGVLIKKAIRRAKIRKNFEKNVRKPKLQAAKIEIAMNNLSEADAAVASPKATPKKAPATKPDKTKAIAQKKEAARKSKVEQYKQKIEKLKKAAEDYSTALSSKYPKDKDMIAALNADSNMQVAKLMLDNEKALTTSEKKRYEQMYNNAVKQDAKYAEEAENAKKEAEEKAKNITPQQQKEVDKNQEELDQAMADQTKKNSKEDQLKRIDDIIKKAEESGDEDKIKKAKALKDKITAKESWNLYDFDVMIFETQISTLELEYELV